MSTEDLRPCPACGGACVVTSAGYDVVVVCAVCRYPFFPAHDSEAQAKAVAAHNTVAVTAHTPLREVERRHIERVLESVRGNRTKAGTILGVGRNTMYRWLKRRGVRVG